jgi:hypothetical protein
MIYSSFSCFMNITPYLLPLTVTYPLIISKHPPVSRLLSNPLLSSFSFLLYKPQREPLADLMEPHKRIWLDEEERAKTMSGSVHKPQPSVLLTKGPDTLVQQVRVLLISLYSEGD